MSYEAGAAPTTTMSWAGGTPSWIGRSAAVAVNPVSVAAGRRRSGQPDDSSNFLHCHFSMEWYRNGGTDCECLDDDDHYRGDIY